MAVTARLESNEIVLRSEYRYRERCKAIPGARWDRRRRAWVYPLSPHSIENVASEFGNDILGHGLHEYLRWSQREAPEVQLKTDPWQHQREAFRFAYGLPGALLAMDMGTGKTRVAIHLLDAWDARTAIVVCPKSVIPVWPAEFAKHSMRAWNCVPLMDGSVKKRTEKARWTMTLGAQRRQPVAVIINYEAVYRKPFDEFALDNGWDVAVWDEIHALKAPGGVQSRFCAKLRDRARRRLGLSGTPAPHSVLDLYGSFRAIDPTVFGTSFTRFRAKYAVMGGYGQYQVVAFQNQDDLNRRFYSAAFRVTKGDVLDLPPTVSTERYCTLSMEERRVYKSLESDFYAWLREAGSEVTVLNALVKLLRLQQCSSGFVGDDDGNLVTLGTSKIDAFREYLDDLPLHEPLVVFCRFVADLEAVKRACAESGRTYSEISGRAKDLEEWQKGETDVLVAQIQSGAEGIDLSRSAQCAFLSVGFSLGQYEQALARLDRPGQTRPVTYTNFIAQGTVDRRVFTALKQRKQVIESILEERK